MDEPRRHGLAPSRTGESNAVELILLVRLVSLVVAMPACSCQPEDPGRLFSPIGSGTVEATEQDWFLASVSLPDENVGFDLDGEDTHCDSGCINDGDGGVDNRLGAVGNAIEDSLGEAASVFFLTNPQHSVDTGSLSLLLKLRRGTDPEGLTALEAYVYNGVDIDGDPTDNATGDETFEVSRDSVIEGGIDSLRDAEYRFDLGGFADSDGYWFDPIDVMIIRFQLPGDAWHSFHLYNAHLVVDPDPGGPTGMIGGAMSVREWVEALSLPEVMAAWGDVDPGTISNILWNQADVDAVPPGPTSDTCVTNEDCPVRWQQCFPDELCHEPPDRMDAISIAMTFEAVRCEITGVAD